MKHSFFAALFLAAAPLVMAQTSTTTPDKTGPTLTITTPAINAKVNLNITGTATDTGGSTSSPAGIRAVYYKVEGSSSWKKATLSTDTAATRTWMASAKVNVATGKRIYFRAVDRSGNESDVIGRRFRFGSAATATTTTSTSTANSTSTK
jgi:hypothetical protein